MNLVPILKIGGEWLSAEDAAKRGLILSENQSNGVHRVALENRSGEAVRIEELGWFKASGRGDFDVKLGQDGVDGFAQSFRALPAVNFPTLAAEGKIVLRGGEAEGRSWFYVVNADEKPARVALRVPSGTRDLATGEAVGARDGGAVALNLEPYDFRSFAAPDGTPALER